MADDEGREPQPEDLGGDDAAPVQESVEMEETAPEDQVLEDQAPEDQAPVSRTSTARSRSRPTSAQPDEGAGSPHASKAGSVHDVPVEESQEFVRSDEEIAEDGVEDLKRNITSAGSHRASISEKAFFDMEEMRQKDAASMKKFRARTGNEDEFSGQHELQHSDSDSMLPLDREGDIIKTMSDPDIEAQEEIPLFRKMSNSVRKTPSIMNVSVMNLMDGVCTKPPGLCRVAETESNSTSESRRESREGIPVNMRDEEEEPDDNMGAVEPVANTQIQPWDQAPAVGGGGGGDDDDGDDYGDDDDDDDDEEEEENANYNEGLDSEDNSDNETDMVVLDPDHPLMKRFQTALKDHLNKQNEKISLELRDLEENLRVKKKEREDLGVELYGVQQELARYQMLLEQKHDRVAGLKQERQKEEQELSDVRELYKENQLNVNKEKKKGSELQSEVENLALRLFYMDNAKEDVRSDIAVMRRAAEKVESEVARAEMDKQKQDLYVDRLVENVDKLKEEIAMYEAQISAQSEETKSAKESLMEAYMEIEAINLEKKDLYQKWNSSLIGMRRRDEAHSAMQEALDQQEQHILSLATEIEGFKKSIQKEQEQNEKLTLILNKTEREIELAKKHMAQVQAKHDALKAEYTTYTRMLHETEQALARATADRTLRTTEVNSLRKQIEQEYLAKVKLEDEVLERMRAQLTLDKASQYSKKLIKKTRDRTNHLETEMAEVENQVANATLDTVNIRTRAERLKKSLAELDEQIKMQNSVISKSEMEIVKRNAIIERKQNQVDIMNKRLNQMIAAAGGVELGPLEIQINSLSKSIEACNQEVMELQQLWLRQQTELVRLSQTKEKEMNDLVSCKRQLTILSQKKIRTENDIDQQYREMGTIEHNIRNMRNDIIKLNVLLHKEKCVGEELEQGNILMENAFISGLKDAEMESIKLQAKLSGIKEEKERLLNSLVEAERQIMLWEKKTQLARETRAAVDSEVGQGEMRAMKSEIHRMQVRHSQLMKQQEKMIQDMEKAVSRRDTIVTRGDAQSKMKKKVLTKGTFERQMGELRKKIKQTIQDADMCDSDIRDLKDHQRVLSAQLEEKQINCQQLLSSSDTMDGDLDRTIELKQKNLYELLAHQQKMKYYQQVKDGKYTMMCRTPAALSLETEKQGDRLQALTAIVDRLNSEFAHAQPALRKVTVMLASRSAPNTEETA